MARKRTSSDAQLDAAAVAALEVAQDAAGCLEAAADVEVLVEGKVARAHTAVLGLASPVFAALLRSGMREGLARRIELPGKSMAEFESFLSFLRPGSRLRVTAETVDRLLPWFNEYQVLALKDECEDVLLGMPCSVSRLLQARTFGLQRRYEQCSDWLSADDFVANFEELAADPDLVRDLLPRMRDKRPTLERVLDLIRDLLADSGSMQRAMPILRVCLNRAGKLDDTLLDAVRLLMNPADSLSGAAVLLENCVQRPEEVRQKVRQDVDAVALSIYSIIPVKGLDVRARNLVQGIMHRV